MKAGTVFESLVVKILEKNSLSALGLSLSEVQSLPSIPSKLPIVGYVFTLFLGIFFNVISNLSLKLIVEVTSKSL